MGLSSSVWGFVGTACIVVVLCDVTKGNPQMLVKRMEPQSSSRVVEVCMYSFFLFIPSLRKFLLKGRKGEFHAGEFHSDIFSLLPKIRLTVDHHFCTICAMDRGPHDLIDDPGETGLKFHCLQPLWKRWSCLHSPCLVCALSWWGFVTVMRVACSRNLMFYVLMMPICSIPE